MTRVVRIVWLVLVWLALWSDLSVANVASGLVVAGVVVALFDTWRPGTVVVRPLAVLRFVLHFALKLVQASLVVARTVVMPKHRIHAGIVAVQLQECSEAVATLVAEAVSLTPGTLTLEVVRDPLTLYIHALDVRDVEQVQAEVRRMEELAVKAFGAGGPAGSRAR